MIRRLRFVSGVLLLTGFMLGLAEAVSASLCGPDMAPVTPYEASGTADAPNAAEHDCPPAHESESDEPEPDAGCPFTFATSAGTCAPALTLPAATTVLKLSSPIESILARESCVAITSAATASIFRPPAA